MLHQETHSADPYASNLHEVVYAIDCSRGADAARFGGKVIVAAMATFGNPGEFTIALSNRDFSTLRVTGSRSRPASPAGGAERGRVIPTADTVYANVLVRVGQTSDFTGGPDRDVVLGHWRCHVPTAPSLSFVDPSYSVASPSRFFDVAQFTGVSRTIDLCYVGISASGALIDDPLRAFEIVRQARGPECSTIAPNGPFTPRVNRIAYDDPRSVFNGCRRHVTLGATRITNGGGSTIWYSDPYGRATRSASFTGGVKQFVGVINNSTAGAVDRVAFGADLDPCLPGSNIHAPN